DAHRDLVSAVAFTPDGKRALSAGYDHRVTLWDLSRGDRVAGFSLTAPVRYIHALAVAADGKQAVLAAERTLLVFDPATRKLIRRLEGHAGWINAVAFAADGKQIISASDDGTARLWDV